jgi:hypothetical protein
MQPILVKPAELEALLAMAKAIKDYRLTVNRAPEPSPRPWSFC